MLILRFDFRRSPGSTASLGDLYTAGLEMCEWADRNQPAMAMFSEHHATDDDYLPSPMVLAGAAAARTRTLPINVGALLLLMYDPVKVAEDMAVLDHLSDGRVSYTIGLGYRDEEYAMFGVDASERGDTMETRLWVLRRALLGDRFEWEGRAVQVRPTPSEPGSPVLGYGGGTAAAARRAARHGLMFFPQSSDPDLAAEYDAEATRVGNPTGLTMGPSPGAPTTVFVAADLDEGWDTYGPHMLRDARAYLEGLGPQSNAQSLSPATTVAELRAEDGAYRVVTPDGAVELLRRHGTLALQPLCGGLAPKDAWRSLELIESDVLPRLGG